MLRKSIKAFLFFALTSCLVIAYHEERSDLEAILPLYRIFKSAYFNAVQANSRRSRRRSFGLNKKFQDVPHDMVFPCNLNITLRSKEIPGSVHKLRPGDIDVIGALGDSLTAGFGVAASNVLEVLHDGRGASFSGGGEKSWRTYLTIPNILKNFNPNLYGFSLQHSLSTDRRSKFNVAEGGAISENMPYMAKVLVKRIQNDKNVHLQKQWKFITLFIGHNDFCSVDCYQKDLNLVLQMHKQDLLEVLRTLRDNLPRTIVNLIPPIHLKSLLLVKDRSCDVVQRFVCPCMIGLPYASVREKLMDLMTKWQELDVEIATYPEFERDDFAVIAQTFTINYSLPMTRQGRIDFTYVAPDCFHMSQKGQAKFTNDVWNSLLEPHGRKIIPAKKEFERFHCPSEESPYIFTRKNSGA